MCGKCPTTVIASSKQVSFHFNATSSSKKYVVCPSCHCRYDFKDLYERRGTQIITKSCLSRLPGSNQCNSDLLKKVHTSFGIINSTCSVTVT